MSRPDGLRRSSNGWIGPTVNMTLQLLLSHVAAAAKNKDHLVPFVEVRRAYFYGEPLPKTFVELSHNYDLDTRRRYCILLRRWLVQDETRCKRLRQRETEKGTKAAGMVMGEMSGCSFKSLCRKLVGVVPGDDILLGRPGSLVDAVRKALRKV